MFIFFVFLFFFNMNNYPRCPNSENPGGISAQGAVKCAYPTSVFQGAVCLSGKICGYGCSGGMETLS